MVEDKEIWKKFLRNQWKICIVFIIGIILAVVGAIQVLLWFVSDAQSTNIVPTTLDLWAMSHLISFIINLILRLILYIGIPVIIACAIIYLLWWKRLPDDERNEYRRGHIFGKQSKRTDGGGIISFLIFIAFIILVYLDGNWNTPFANWTFDYAVYTYLWAFIWIVIICGIPMAIGGLLWLRYELSKTD